MNPKKTFKRLFFGCQLQAPWPPAFPAGRILKENCRHLTLAFLGATSEDKMIDMLASVPTPPMQVGCTGYFDNCLFLPPRSAHVVAWHMRWSGELSPLEAYRKNLILWLKDLGLKPDEKESFLAHMTIARAPFNHQEWKKSFAPLPFFISHVHLYESVGDLTYEPIWTYPLELPFLEIEHTADLAFRIHGENLQQLYHHALSALCFKFPPLVNYLEETVRKKVTSHDDIIFFLNTLIAHVDGLIGCPFKAVCFCGELIKKLEGILQWEMIIDV